MVNLISLVPLFTTNIVNPEVILLKGSRQKSSIEVNEKVHETLGDFTSK